MKELPKIKEFTKKELQEQLKNKKINVDFLIDYIVKIDEVYNLLIDKVNKLEERTHKAMTLIQLIQMSDEIDWGDINTLINILKGEENGN